MGIAQFSRYPLGLINFPGTVGTLVHFHQPDNVGLFFLDERQDASCVPVARSKVAGEGHGQMVRHAGTSTVSDIV